MWSLHVLLVSAWVLSRYSGFLPQSKDMQRNRLINNSKLPVGVNLSMSGCLSLCTSPDIIHFRRSTTRHKISPTSLKSPFSVYSMFGVGFRITVEQAAYCDFTKSSMYTSLELRVKVRKRETQACVLQILFVYHNGHCHSRVYGAFH